MTAWHTALRAASLPFASEALRAEVRAFLDQKVASGAYEPRCDNWLTGADPAFSRELGERGWLGLTIPTRYGGHGRTALDRFAVAEELLAAGAPVAAHWFADRQMAPSLLRHGTEEQKQRYLPSIARGECYFAIGMSEPDAGSDLAAVRSRAEPVEGGWLLNGTKLWSSGAHVAHAIVVLVRTSAPDDDRHRGLSQFVVDLPRDGVTVRPIGSLDGRHHFNEVVFTDALVPVDALLGRLGDGWAQVTGELAFERSGPERLLTTLPLLTAWMARLARKPKPDPIAARASGRLLARLWVLRQLSLAVAQALDTGASVDVEAALVKDLGTQFEGDVVDVVRSLADLEPDPGSDEPFARLLADAVLHAPAFTLRGGTTEILRGVVARSLGIR